MSEFDYYIQQGEPSQREKAEAWAMAIGYQSIGRVTADPRKYPRKYRKTLPNNDRIDTV